MIFSLAPASSLTLIDYQTFVRNAGIDACIFDDPTPETQVCGQQDMVQVPEGVGVDYLCLSPFYRIVMTHALAPFQSQTRRI